MTRLLERDKPLIGMVHLPALPGTPFATGMSRKEMLSFALRDRDALLDAGFDFISFSNEGDRPYITDVPKETVALITWLIAGLTRDLDTPFGCGVLIDPRASLAVAHAVGASFIRVSYGVTAGPFGLLIEQPGEILRFRHEIGADDIQLFVNLSPHFSTTLDTRPLVERAKSYHSLTEADAIQIHGAGAGSPPDLAEVAAVKDALSDVPVIVASGVTEETVQAALAVSDGVIVGTSLKRDGKIFEPVDPQRAAGFVRAARADRVAST